MRGCAVGTPVDLRLEISRLSDLARERVRWIFSQTEGAAVVDGDFIVTTFDRWCTLGELPATGDVETTQEWVALHHCLADVFSLPTQRVHVSVVGFVGAAQSQLVFVVDDQEVAVGAEPRWPGNRPWLPVVAFAIRESRIHPGSSRQEQLARWARVRAILDRAAILLEGRLVVTFDAHLAKLEVQTPTRFKLGWVPGDTAQPTVSLQLEAITEGGETQPVPLDALDPATGILAADASRPMLLPSEVVKLAGEAKKRQRVPVSRARAEVADPSLVIPEGWDPDPSIDLSAYADRVLGFEVARSQRALVFVAESRSWVGRDTDPSAPFLELTMTEGAGGPRTSVTMPTAEDARGFLSEAALAVTREPPLAGRSQTVTYEGRRIAATSELVDTVRRAVRLHEDASKEGDPRALEQPGKRYTAIIEELSQTNFDVNGPLIDESIVPWDRLGELLRPSISLQPHQRRGIAWLCQHARRNEPGVLLADDMGLGKTLQVAAFLALRFAEQRRGTDLVVAPVILLEGWRTQLNEFFRDEVFANTVILHGPGLDAFRRGNSLAIDALARHRLILTNYDTLSAYQLSLLRLDFEHVVFDEAQEIKNETTKRARAAQGLKRKFAIGLTGTPVENRLSDLWAIFEALQQRSDRRAFGTRTEFEAAYEKRGEAGIADVRRRLGYPTQRSVVLRREKDVLRDVPKMVEPQFVPVEMTPHEAALETVVRREMAGRGPFAVIDRLQKLYQHPQLLDGEAALTPTTGANPKVRATLAILQTIAAKDEKALIFTFWRDMQWILASLCMREFKLPRVDVINGSPGARDRANEIIDRFSSHPGFNVLILSPRSAGAGLNIQAANHVIHYGRWWNPAKEDQATGRAYRMRQTRPVHVYYPLLHHPGAPESGFDAQLNARIQAKRAVARDFLTPVEDLEITAADLIGDQPSTASP